MFITVAALIIILLVITLFSSVNIRITYYRDNKDDELIIIVSALFGLINFKREYNLLELMSMGGPGLKVRGELEATAGGRIIKEFGSLVNVHDALESYKKYKLMIHRYGKAIRYIQQRIAIKKLEWNSVLGTGDAAVTGIAIGLLWNVKTFFTSVLSSRFKLLSLPQISIVPSFESIIISTRADCILSVKIGHAITAGTIGLIAKKKDGDAIE